MENIQKSCIIITGWRPFGRETPMEIFILLSGDEIRNSGSWTIQDCLEQEKDFLYGSQIQEYVDNLDIEIQIDFYRKLGGLRIGSKDTSGTNFRKWEKNIYELTFGKLHRLFFLLDDNKVVLLYACKKQKNKTEGVDCKNIRKKAQSAKKSLIE